MKIALLTIWREKNYGAELQAYATIKILQQLGHEATMIDIRLSDCAHLNLTGHIGNLLTQWSPSHKKFCTFWDTHIPTTRRYKSLKELQTSPPKADIYIVGSDQVWNPDITKDFSTLYFLDFGDNNVKRISYASSFGTSEWKHPQLKEKIYHLLHRFDAITCREQSGVKILRDEFNLTSQNVIDPTLFFKNYPELTGPLQEENTLCFYPLSPDPELEEYAFDLANRLHLHFINNKQCTFLFKRIVWERVSIEDWIRNIAQAQFVLTRSFHGMIFSILYHRQFAVVAGKQGRDTRLLNLLNQLGLENHFFQTIEELETTQPWTNIINYEKIDKILYQMRETSLNYLKEMLHI